ncbi:hypothetical protein M0811_04684 [Anaeramoeba ignava]|uniref:Uncharacterized protein n=1 Tax=Anaeramoeba ignava TaxID=1746090 RepID=A0A9Q0LUL7_ANAIG|nr:hypothetical protein M0811_04684 [Anaeramoeba ignava]
MICKSNYQIGIITFEMEVENQKEKITLKRLNEIISHFEIAIKFFSHQKFLNDFIEIRIYLAKLYLKYAEICHENIKLKKFIIGFKNFLDIQSCFPLNQELLQNLTKNQMFQN